MHLLKYLFLATVAVAGGCSTPAPKTATPAPAVQTAAPVAEAKPPPLPSLPAAYTQKGVMIKIEGLWRSADGEILGVTGTAKNVAASDLRFCQVSVALFDEAGAMLDNAKVSTKSLKSGQIWHFQAALTHPAHASYASIVKDKVVAIPIKVSQGELAALK